MRLALWTVMALVTSTLGRNFYFYADIRWEKIDYYAEILRENDTPFNHGLRLLPAILAAQYKIKNGLRIWSRSPTVTGNVVNNEFYQSNAEYVAICKGIDGSESASNCFLNSNYDIGFCSPTALQPIKDPSTITSLHCKNNPQTGHIISFKEKDNSLSTSIPLLKEGENLYIILPDGSGLRTDVKKQFIAKFGGARTKSLTLGELNERIKFIADTYGNDFAGIIASTENVYYTAIISKNLKVPNIVPQVSDKEGNLIMMN